MKPSPPFFSIINLERLDAFELESAGVKDKSK